MRRNILITGASAGLGAEMARQFAAKGHNLALTARRTERLEALQTELAERYPQLQVVIHSLDVNDHDQVFEVFRKVDTVPGVRAMVAAIESEKSKGYVPSWPWVPLAQAMRFAPLAVLKRML